MVTTPDLITFLDIDTGEPITTESMRFGLRVAALAIPETRSGGRRKGSPSSARAISEEIDSGRSSRP